jgi:hypothetical protein
VKAQSVGFSLSVSMGKRKRMRRVCGEANAALNTIEASSQLEEIDSPKRLDSI